MSYFRSDRALGEILTLNFRLDYSTVHSLMDVDVGNGS